MEAARSAVRGDLSHARLELRDPVRDDDELERTELEVIFPNHDEPASVGRDVVEQRREVDVSGNRKKLRGGSAENSLWIRTAADKSRPLLLKNLPSIGRPARSLLAVVGDEATRPPPGIRAHPDFGTSGFVRAVGHPAAVGRKARGNFNVRAREEGLGDATTRQRKSPDVPMRACGLDAEENGACIGRDRGELHVSVVEPHGAPLADSLTSPGVCGGIVTMRRPSPSGIQYLSAATRVHAPLRCPG